MSRVSAEYVNLLQEFLRGDIRGADLRRQFFTKFKAESHELDERTYGILDGLFADLDAFVSDPQTFRALSDADPGWYLDEAALRTRITDALRMLQS